MSDLTIITNNQPRPLIYGCELSEKARAEFDYYDSEELDSNAFFKYKGQIYDLGEFMRIENHPDSEFSSWHGYHSESAFSGVLVKLTDDSDSVIVGRYYS